jgi:hypothetical protein
MVDPSDAPGVTIPYVLLASKDEDQEAVGKWQSGLKVKNVVETFTDQIHGWMAARCVHTSYEVENARPLI